MSTASVAESRSALAPPEGEVVYKIADTRDERESAFRRVYESYVRSGLSAHNLCGMRVTPFHLLDTTEVFISCLHREVIATVSLVRDGELGMPLETIYADEVRHRRACGLRLGEVSCLADRRSEPRRFFPNFVQLSKLMVQCAKRRGLDQLLVCVHPRHARFYERYLGFQVIGEERAYSAVQGRPAIPLCLDFERIERDRPACYDSFFGTALPEAALRSRPMSTAEREYFAQAVRFNDLETPLLAEFAA